MFALSASTARAAPVVASARAPRASKSAPKSVARVGKSSAPAKLSARRDVACFAAKDEAPPGDSAAKGLGKALPMEMDIDAIMKLLPHRYPFLLVDRVLEIEQGKYAIGLKNVTINDNFFPGHFPQRPIMPGVLMVEAMAQVGGLIMLDPEASGDGEGANQEGDEPDYGDLFRMYSVAELREIRKRLRKEHQAAKVLRRAAECRSGGECAPCAPPE